ncbi:ADP-ribose 1''-phosphate phosphatase [Favolaschia claudopus]|uniref:ADP-ribose 1''-phosphate phosphatase n=1 Tax=Favolaschia claudopus TaxID=2862362 RepID=A0AAW0BWY7_9AGAR
MSQPAPMNTITHVKADLFAAPKGSILIHACNTRGSWGAGIAIVFKERYPKAFVQFKDICKLHGAALLGTCLLIRGDSETHDIACLFTSKDYGKRVDSPNEILTATRLAVEDLLRQNENPVKELHACRFNSERFGVPWDETEKVLVELGAVVTVYERP